jgi:AcrR family transcriptional regulator
MPKGFTAREKEVILQRLLEQGYKQFSAYGLKKTNIDELAVAAGISKGAFYLFYESKEAFFMAVMELVERNFRQQVLEQVDFPGPTPRGRLLAVFKRFFDLFKTIPMMRGFTGSDLDVLSRRVPAEIFEAHLANDRLFLATLIARCRQAGIPITAPPEQVTGLLYALLTAYLHQDDLGPNAPQGMLEVLLELTAAYCLGEVALSTPLLEKLEEKHDSTGD